MDLHNVLFIDFLSHSHWAEVIISYKLAYSICKRKQKKTHTERDRDKWWIINIAACSRSHWAAAVDGWQWTWNNHGILCKSIISDATETTCNAHEHILFFSFSHNDFYDRNWFFFTSTIKQFSVLITAIGREKPFSFSLKNMFSWHEFRAWKKKIIDNKKDRVQKSANRWKKNNSDLTT